MQTGFLQRLFESTANPGVVLGRKLLADVVRLLAQALVIGLLGLCYQGHVLIENANGLVVNARASIASGFAERENALALLAELPGTKARTVGADKAYDTAQFVAAARQIEVTPHVAQNLGGNGGWAIDGRTTRQPVTKSASASAGASKNRLAGRRPSG